MNLHRSLLVFALVVMALPSIAFAQPRRIGRPARPVGPAGAAPVETAKADEVPDVEPVRKPREPLPPRFVVLKLADGSTVAGDLTVEDIKVTTEFGELTIPIAKIKSFTPGLGSNPAAAADLAAKLKDLESDDYRTREEAHKALSALGPKIAKQLAPHASSENAEVKRHVTELLKEFEQQAEEASDDDEGAEKRPAWINEDTIETTQFTVTGKVSPEQFEIASKYGPLKIALGDIVRASRPAEAREAIQKSLSVAGEHMVQRSFKSTGLRVQAGDRVTINASGNVTLTPWGNNTVSGPDGMPNNGWYVPGSIPVGTLVYRIGDKGQVQKAGSKASFVAKSSGVIQLAIGMQAEYGNQGYQFPGEYKVKVKVSPE